MIVDDHAIMREGLRRMLGDQEDMVVVGSAGNGRLAMKQIGTLAPDVVVMDMYLGEERGIDIARQILVQLPQTKIVMLSVEMNQAIVTEALQAGVSAYVAKTNTTDELVRAIHTVMDGRIYLCPELASPIVDAYMKTVSGLTVTPSKPTLSPAESDLLKLIVSGKRNKEIAEALGVCINTAGTRRARLMRKLNCSTVSELTRFAVREGIVQP
jgi:DNA-binding NarL/FixJ family response regulator